MWTIAGRSPIPLTTRDLVDPVQHGLQIRILLRLASERRHT